MNIAIVSGGFDPVHIGHVKLFQAAAEYGRVIVILNNDNWLTLKKGKTFMPQDERRYIIEEMRSVSEVIITEHSENDEDRSVCRELKKIREKYPEDDLFFINGGDRKEGFVPEDSVCKDNNINLIYNAGGEKIQSSSWLTNNA